MTIRLFTDGSCLSHGNERRPGGWAAVAFWPDGRHAERVGSAYGTDSTTMEIRAAIEGLRLVRDADSPVMLFTDCLTIPFVLRVHEGNGSFRRGKNARPLTGAQHKLWNELVSAVAAVAAIHIRYLTRRERLLKQYAEHKIAHNLAKTNARIVHADRNGHERPLVKRADDWVLTQEGKVVRRGSRAPLGWKRLAMPESPPAWYEEPGISERRRPGLNRRPLA